MLEECDKRIRVDSTDRSNVICSAQQSSVGWHREKGWLRAARVESGLELRLRRRERIGCGLCHGWRG